ncbi:MAG: RNA-binding protein [Chloroflexi bacterium]|nr:RNA-binding protein [Chloroflexota bacterium]|tara:strand:+ start:11 stop:256 length:246 start_codon:yes stop_codon:yes gene_type:complete
MSDESLAPMVEYIAKAIASNPDEVSVEEEVNEDGVVQLKLFLAQEDKGRIIGRKGQVARAIRSILRVGAVKRNQVIRLNID